MKLKYRTQGDETLVTINRLLQHPVDRLAVILRHSERNFSENAALEPFMGLTENGKHHAFNFGFSFENHFRLKLFSSPFGRCIETAYLIDKGYYKKNGISCPHPVLSFDLSPFYIKNIETAVKMIYASDNNQFLRSWFDRQISHTIMLDPEETAHRILDFMAAQMDSLVPGEIALCISHDWNIFPVKEYKMGLKHEKWGSVGYLDGIALFKKDNRYYLSSRQKNPVMVSSISG